MRQPRPAAPRLIQRGPLGLQLPRLLILGQAPRLRSVAVDRERAEADRLVGGEAREQGRRLGVERQRSASGREIAAHREVHAVNLLSDRGPVGHHPCATAPGGLDPGPLVRPGFGERMPAAQLHPILRVVDREDALAVGDANGSAVRTRPPRPVLHIQQPRDFRRAVSVVPHGRGHGHGPGWSRPPDSLVRGLLAQRRAESHGDARGIARRARRRIGILELDYHVRGVLR